MSLGAIDFGLIVDGAVIIVENCLRRLAEKQHELGRTLTLAERLAEVTQSAREMIRPSVFGQAIIITVYLPILTLTGVEGKMFRPMALTVILALVAAFVLSLTFVPAMVAILVRGRVRERENLLVRVGEAGVRAVAEAGGFACETSSSRRSAVLFAAVGPAVHAARAGVRADAGRAGRGDARDAHPEHEPTQSTEMQADVERTISRLPEVAFVFSKTGTAEMASDPMPPNVSDTFIILKPASQRGEVELDRLIAQREAEAEKLGGTREMTGTGRRVN